MVASPLDLDLLDVDHEKRLVEEATKDLRADGLIDLTWLEGHTWRDLQRAMRGGLWHVFHFIGHGGFDLATEEGAIALADESGRKYLLGATGLAGLLDGHYPLRMVVLNSCEGAKGGDSDAFSSTAATLVRRGIPAVLAMQYEITDEAAITFSRDFYQAVADGLPVDAAVSEARKAIVYSQHNSLEWGTPVLYMRSEDGRIFDISAQAPPVDPPQEEDSEEQDRRQRLEELYERARQSYRAQDWRAVVEAFNQIREVDPEYPDSEELLRSAHEALAAPPSSSPIHYQDRGAETEWQERRRRVFGAIASALTGVAFIVTGLINIVDIFWLPVSTLPPIAMLVGLTGLHIWHTSSYGRLGLAAFLTAVVGLVAVLVGFIGFEIAPESTTNLGILPGIGAVLAVLGMVLVFLQRVS